jgi:hypothetical protein
MQSRPHWQQSITPDAAAWSKNLMQLLMNSSNSDRPDGLLISDDNLVPHATAGLLASGISIPGELDVVAHCNYPSMSLSMVRAKRIGFDARTILDQAILMVDKQRRGVSGSMKVDIAARFDHEVSSDSREAPRMTGVV